MPISPESTSPLREVLVFCGLTIALTWLFWVPGAFLPMGSAVGDFLLALGSLAPLAVAVFLQVWVQKRSMTPTEWVRTLNAERIALAVFTPITFFAPVILLRVFQGTLTLGNMLDDLLRNWLTLMGLLFVSIAEEIGWRAYLLPRLKNVPLSVANLFTGLVWFVWLLPLVLAGRYNTSENYSSFVLAMFLYALLITPFLNRIALRGNCNPILSGILRAVTNFVIAVYFLQGRGDPLTDTFGNLTIAWLVLLNVVLFPQLWQGKKPPAHISELERVMPFQAGD
jgi:membrane protease YdiL (CAAX protease family)